MYLKYDNILPKVDPSSFVANTAVISGDVKIAKNCGIWFGCVIRGDVSPIIIGNNTNIQDNTIIHGTRANHLQNKTGDQPAAVNIGKNVTVGHGAIIHACNIADNAFIGMGSIIMDLAVVEENAMIAAGAVVTPKKIIKSGEIWAGNPAKFFRKMTDEEIKYIQVSADNYRQLADEYKVILQGK